MYDKLYRSFSFYLCLTVSIAASGCAMGDGASETNGTGGASAGNDGSPNGAPSTTEAGDAQATSVSAWWWRFRRSHSTGGRRATGGVTGSGGNQATGGAIGSGGSQATGGVTGSGGNQATGGAIGSGGGQATGGAIGSGGSAPGSGGSGGPIAGSTATRPSYNKGVGFFVLNGKLYDANGHEFRIRGIDKLHWDNMSLGLAASYANTVRWNVDFTRSASSNVALLQGGAGKTAGTIYNKMVVIPGMWSTPAGELNCSDDPAVLASAVSTWVSQASTWAQIEKYSIINIANEWGPRNSTVWRDSYISAISQLRAAGIHATLSIDSGGCGQDNPDLVNYAQAVFNSDPEKNIIFDRHIYGVNPDVNSLTSDASALAALGLPIMFGEFGPGRNIGPSPTNLTPQQVIQVAEQYGFGWIGWAWDDNDLANAAADNAWFALSYNGAYGSSGDLTIFGQQVVEGCLNPAPGGCGCPDSPVPAMTIVEPNCSGKASPSYSNYSLKNLAVTASIF